MSDPQITLDAGPINSVEEKLHGALEEQLTSALRAATEKTKHRYAGESVEQVTETLLARTREGLHPDIAAAFHPDMTELRRVAEAIVAGVDTRDLTRPRSS